MDLGPRSVTAIAGVVVTWTVKLVRQRFTETGVVGFVRGVAGQDPLLPAWLDPGVERERHSDLH
jgi:hypothetical protein